jgi:hypothetical protein
MEMFVIATRKSKEERKPIYMQWLMQAVAPYLAAVAAFALFASACPRAIVAPVA